MRSVLGLMLAATFVAAPAIVHAAPQGRVELDRVAAVVGDEVILLSELQRSAARHPLMQEGMASLPAGASQKMVQQKTREVTAKVLDELIDTALMRAEAAKFDIKIGEEEVDAAVADIARQYQLTVDDLRKQVIASAEYGSWADYRNEVRDQILQYRLPQYLATWSVSEAQVREHYRKMTKDESAKVEVRQLVFNPPTQKSGDRDRVFARAQAAARELREGKTMDEVAEGLAQESPTRTVGRGDVAPAIEDALFEAKDKQVVGPLASGQGYVVFKVIAHLESAALDYEKAKDRIRQQLEAEAFIKAQNELRAQLRAKAHIDIRI
jgi:peptidyl-prolyl cis-trans isomerase SurA